MINFKKVVSMAVVLSLMLGACGKNPARRDAETDDNSANNKVIESIAADTNTNPKDKPSEHWTRTGVGARVGVVFGIAILLTVTESALFACRDFRDFRSFPGNQRVFHSLPGNPRVFCSTVGALVGMVMAGWIVGWMSKAAGDGWKKVMLNTVIAGLVTAGMIGIGTGMVRRAGVGSAQLQVEAARAVAEWKRTSVEELNHLIDAAAEERRAVSKKKRGGVFEKVRIDIDIDDDVLGWEDEKLRHVEDAKEFARNARNAREEAKNEKRYIIGDEAKAGRKATKKFQEMRKFQKKRRKLIPKYAKLNAMVTMSSQVKERQKEKKQLQKYFNLKILLLELDKDTCKAEGDAKTEWAKGGQLLARRSCGGGVEELKMEARMNEANVKEMEQRIENTKNELHNRLKNLDSPSPEEERNRLKNLDSPSPEEEEKKYEREYEYEEV